jgi:hypothetical protein
VKRAPPSGDSAALACAAVLLHDQLHDRQPETVAAGRPVARTVEAGEGVNTLSRSSAGNADAVVVDMHQDLLADDLRADPDALGVLDGVAQQVGNRVGHAPAIELDVAASTAKRAVSTCRSSWRLPASGCLDLFFKPGSRTQRR